MTAGQPVSRFIQIMSRIPVILYRLGCKSIRFKYLVILNKVLIHRDPPPPPTPPIGPSVPSLPILLGSSPKKDCKVPYVQGYIPPGAETLAITQISLDLLHISLPWVMTTMFLSSPDYLKQYDGQLKQLFALAKAEALPYWDLAMLGPGPCGTPGRWKTLHFTALHSTALWASRQHK